MNPRNLKIKGEGNLLDGRYELLSVIGRGGNSLVYVARPTEEVRAQLNLPEIVTVKLFTDSASSPGILARIQREVLLLKTISHPLVVKIYDYSASFELSYIVMEYAGRGDVKTLLEEQGRLEPGLALRLAIQMLDALQAVHAAGVIHRDLKPENLLLLADGGIRLGDFGVSTFLGDDPVLRDSDNVVRGTLGYIAPEQLKGESETQAIDIFAAGVSLFEMLTGALPYEAQNIALLLDKMVNSEPRKLTDILGDEFQAFDTILAPALSADPDRRYSSALEFRRALEQLVWKVEKGNAKSRQVPVDDIAIETGEERPDYSRALIYSAVTSALLATIFMTFLFISRDHATANLRRAAPQPVLTEKGSNALERVKLLTESPRTGVFFNLLGDGKNVHFSTSPVRVNDQAQPDRFILTLGINGFRPQLITLAPDSKSREIHLAAGGLRIVLEVGVDNREPNSKLSGKFRDLSTGRVNRWAVY
jgi:serine/threonine protein kinase